MTLSLGQPKFKTCPNCGGDGFENNPPMRRCGICKGRGRLPYAPTTKGVGRNPNEALAPAAGLSTRLKE
jgi:DnaJ-class molecular chaperone